MIHLANQRDPGAKDDRAHGGAEIGEDRLAGAGEPGAETMGGKDAGKQDRQAQQAGDLYPMRRDERQERRGDQEAADDGHHHRDVDAGSERRKCDADGGDSRRRDHAIGFPSRKISFEALPIGPVKHHGGLAAHALGDGIAAAYDGFGATASQFQDPVQMLHDVPHRTSLPSSRLHWNGTRPFPRPRSPSSRPWSRLRAA